MFTKPHTRHGMPFPNAYWKRMQVNPIAWPEAYSVNFYIYPTKAVHDDGGVVIDTREVLVPIPDIYSAAADFTPETLEAALRTAVLALPDFDDATPA